MDKKILLIIIIVSLLLTGCGKSISTNTAQQDGKSSAVAPTNSADANSTETTTPAENKTENIKTQMPSENNKNYSVLEAYKAVLQNKVNFLSTDNKKNVYLNDLLTNKEIYGTIFKITHFTVLDMDGDKIPEVILELSDGDNNPICFEVLHYMNAKVYGYNIVYRGLEELKTDGTFIYSSGAADNGCGKLRFESNVYKTDTLGYSKSSQGDANLTISYFINNKPVTEESFNSFMKEQHGKKDAVWYEFSQKNIETELSINP